MAAVLPRFGGQCGSTTALWVQEMLPVGWGDTYSQSVAGQSFDISNLPNGTYYIEVLANPQKVLHESNTTNDVSLRQVILGGKPGHRTVRCPRERHRPRGLIRPRRSCSPARPCTGLAGTTQPGPGRVFSSRDGQFKLRVRATGLPRGDDHVPSGSTASRPGRHRFRRPIGAISSGGWKILRGIRAYNRVRSGAKRIVVGNRGIGKSAIFQVLARRERDEGSYVIELSPEDYSYELLSQTMASEGSGSWAKLGAYAVAWKYLIYVLIMKEVSRRKVHLKKGEASRIYRTSATTTPATTPASCPPWSPI